MSYSWLGAQGSGCYEQPRVVNDMKESRSHELKPLDVWTSHIGSMRSHSMVKLSFYLFMKKLIYCLENDLESPLIFVLFFFKRVNKIRKKTLSVTPYSKNVVYEKPNRGLGSGYLLGRYNKDRNTPLNP